MTKILIVYSKMIVGGSTTSLISILNSIDYSKYQVDLQLFDNSGELQGLIHKSVVVLPELKNKNRHLKFFFYITNFWSFLYAKLLSRIKGHNPHIQAQVMSKILAKSNHKNTKFYDIGISFLEFWPMEYLILKTFAKKKISWIHIDLKGAGIIPKISLKSFQKVNSIIVVSESCKTTFVELFPNMVSKVSVFDNISDSKTIIELSKQSINDMSLDSSKINMITVCRIDFNAKGIDRALAAFLALKNGNKLSKLNWYIVGDGKDMDKLKKYIDENRLENNVFVLGRKINPYPYMKPMDVFFLPSRYEGKPMAVTEAQILSIVPMVTEYASARNQINHLVDGVIVPNQDSSIYDLLINLENELYDIKNMKLNLSKNDFSNEDNIRKFYELF